MLTSYQLSVISYQLSVISYLRSTSYQVGNGLVHPLFTVYCSLFPVKSSLKVRICDVTKY
ncbi:hypothetical protein DP116_07625 [Brasilonema bromeliae SPC951]|uniref:Uncharacterized protein n=1 Tax=Brasilonema bromeliae SPC951 TaxID=385972 RepID=A0ABX1P4N8_9CYAN|nr:hypothetical protein [Brasilonema bromeliae SPC951]